MKRAFYVVLLGLVFSVMDGSAQYFTSSGSGHIYTVNPAAHFGLGDNLPVDKLTVKDGNVSLLKTNDATERFIRARSSVGALSIMTGTSTTDGSYIRMLGANYSGGCAGCIQFVSRGTTGTAFQFMNYNPSTSQWESKMIIDKEGKVGIGSTPTNRLTVNGMIGFDGGNSGFRNIYGNSDNYGLVLYGNSSWADGSGAVFSGNNSNAQGKITFVSGGSSNNTVACEFVQYNGGVFDVSMDIRKNGKVVIGDVPVAGDYNLYVKNGILTEKVKVALSSTGEWSDFVFKEGYQLMPLTDVASFIQENGHLPGIPSAEEVVEHGIDLGAMDAKLLQKIEELILYVIQQQKEIEMLKKQLPK